MGIEFHTALAGIIQVTEYSTPMDLITALLAIQTCCALRIHPQETPETNTYYYHDCLAYLMIDTILHEIAAKNIDISDFSSPEGSMRQIT